MSSKPNPTAANEENNPSEQMNQLRQLVLGKDNQLVKDSMREHARELVGEVFSEALHDRQTTDGSVNKVIGPLVEKSVEKSVETRKEQFVGYLYPLVGSLVRKSVSAFFNDLMEKTNELIENSLTIKGIKWRFRAWQAGISFSEYVARQTFSFRVEQLFLIHRETSVLLHTITYAGRKAADADLVSAMLSAISDFVEDSFDVNTQRREQKLNVIKTSDFTLLLTQGPQANLVAAVSGTVPQGVSDQMEHTLQDIHTLFGKELSQFDGDTLQFENTEQQLCDCLITQLKPDANKPDKKPWLAWLLFSLVSVALVIGLVNWWQLNQLHQQVAKLDQEPGILVRHITKDGWSNLNVQLMRDPNAVGVHDWLNQHNIDAEKIQLFESGYVSLDPQLKQTRIQKLLPQYPELKLHWDGANPLFSGTLSGYQRQILQRQLNQLPGVQFNETILANVQISDANPDDSTSAVIDRTLLDMQVAKIETMQIDFAKGISDLAENEVGRLHLLANEFESVINLANKLGFSVGLVVMGASDSVGGKSYNQQLSQQRAENALAVLLDAGIDPGYLTAVGLGVVELKGAGARKVLFNVIYFE